MFAATLAVALVAGPPGGAPQEAGVAITCRSVLTDQEISKAAGRRMTPAGEMHTIEHRTACTWIGADPGATVTRLTVVVFDPREASAAKSVPAGYDEAVAAALESFSQQEPLTGIGQRAVFFPGDPDMQILVVQLADGIVQFNATGIGKDALTALARAAASR